MRLLFSTGTFVAAFAGRLIDMQRSSETLSIGFLLTSQRYASLQLDENYSTPYKPGSALLRSCVSLLVDIPTCQYFLNHLPYGTRSVSKKGRQFFFQRTKVEVLVA